MTKRFTTGMAQIDPRFILWRKIRIPLALAIVTILLVISAVLLYSHIVARGIRRDLARAAELAATDTFESQGEAREILEGLFEEHPDHEAIRAQLAWHRVLLALRYGATPDRLAAARQALAGTEGIEPSPELLAARGGLALIEGDAEAALRAVGDRPTTRDGLYVRALALASQGDVDQALVVLDQARQGVPTFVPALSELALLLRQRGRFDEAQSALVVLSRASPSNQDAVVQEVLLALDRGAAGGREGGAKLASLAPELSKKLAALTIDEQYPKSLAYKRFATGRLDLIAGDVGAAEKSLGEAANVLDTNQSVATWLAVARHRAGAHEGALEALARFPDAETTDSALIRARLEILLALHRTADAQAPFAVLSKRGESGIASVEGRILYARGDPEKAVGPLRAALAAGDAEAGILLAEALVSSGRADDARATLRGIKGQGPEALCAEGFRAYVDGRTRPALEALRGASKAGGRCGPVLLGRFLAGSGGATGQDAALAAALAEREDVRDRVVLGRLRFRADGSLAAKAELDQVKALHPQGALVLRELALAYVELGMTDAAKAVATEAVQATKANPLVVSVAVRLAREGDQLAEAAELLERGQKVAPQAPCLQLERAAVLFSQNRFPDASDAVGEALQPGAAYAEAACLRAEVQLRRGERETAQVDLNRAVLPAKRHSGAESEIAVRECLVEYHLKRGPSAIGRAKTALFFLRQMPFESAQIEYLTGQIAERESRLEEAGERYRKAVELDPTHRGAWNRLAKLQLLGDDDRRRFEKLWPGVSPGER